MAKQGVWEISENGPRRLGSSTVELEKHLEDWIERDPSLVQHGLTIAARQLPTEAGPLDLLALDPQGRWVVIEIKRGLLRRDSVAQALDYASALATMTLGDLEQPVNGYLESNKFRGALEDLLRQRQVVFDRTEQIGEVAIIVVGTGRDRGFERMVRYLSNPGNVPITIVSFDVFQLAGGKRVLVRELSDDENAPVPDTEIVPDAIQLLLKRAEAAGIGIQVGRIVRGARLLGRYPRSWKKSVMLTSPANKTRCLLTAWTEPTSGGKILVYAAPDAFVEFCGLDRETVVKELLGADGWFQLPRNKVDSLVDGLGRLLTPPPNTT